MRKNKLLVENYRQRNNHLLEQEADREKIIGIKPNSFEHYGIRCWYDTEVKNLDNSTYFWTVKVKILKFYKCNCSSKKGEQPLPFKREIQIMRQTEVWKDERKK